MYGYDFDGDVVGEWLTDVCFSFQKARLTGNKILLDIKFAAKDRGCNIFPLFHVEILKEKHIAEIYFISLPGATTMFFGEKTFVYSMEETRLHNKGMLFSKASPKQYTG